MCVTLAEPSRGRRRWPWLSRRLGWLAGGMAAFPRELLIAWFSLAICYSPLPWRWLRLTLSLAFLAFALWAWWWKRRPRVSLAFAAVCLAVFAAYSGSDCLRGALRSAAQLPEHPFPDGGGPLKRTIRFVLNRNRYRVARSSARGLPAGPAARRLRSHRRAQPSFRRSVSERRGSRRQEAPCASRQTARHHAAGQHRLDPRRHLRQPSRALARPPLSGGACPPRRPQGRARG